jgi:hypothetical protein
MIADILEPEQLAGAARQLRIVEDDPVLVRAEDGAVEAVDRACGGGGQGGGVNCMRICDSTARGWRGGEGAVGGDAPCPMPCTMTRVPRRSGLSSCLG